MVYRLPNVRLNDRDARGDFLQRGADVFKLASMVREFSEQTSSRALECGVQGEQAPPFVVRHGS